MSDDKPTPIHYNGGQTACGIGTVDATTDTAQVTCPECLAWIEKRRAAVERGPDSPHFGSGVTWPVEYDTQQRPIRVPSSIGGADEHPPPWTWRDSDPGRPALVAADGSLVIFDEGDGVIVSDRVDPDVRARVRALIAAAPEMASLLHELAGPDRCSCSPPCAYERARDLLARLDKAKGE